VKFRNTPNVSRPLEKRDWHALLGIPSGQRIFLNAGTLGDWAQVPEILSSIVHWPSDSVLLLHSRTPEQEGGYQQQLSHLHVPGRVFWTSAPLSEKLLNSLDRPSSPLASIPYDLSRGRALGRRCVILRNPRRYPGTHRKRASIPRQMPFPCNARSHARTAGLESPRDCAKRQG
jgi:hypothetical protein